MTSSWSPDMGKLQQVVQLLETTISAGDNETHRRVQQEVDSGCQNAEFGRYLAYVFAYAQENHGASDQLKQMSGLILRKAVEAGLRPENRVLDPVTILYIQEAVVRNVGDQDRNIRRAACNICTTIAREISIKECLDLLRFVVTTLQNHSQHNENQLEGAFLLVSQLCEELADEMDSDACGRPFNILVPIFIEFLGSPNVNFREKSLLCLNNLLVSVNSIPAAMEVNIENYLRGLSSLTADPNPSIRRHVCAGLSVLTTARIDVIVPHIDSIVQFMMLSMKDGDSFVRLEACDFWAELSYYPMVASKVLLAYLPQLVPSLLVLMVYSDDELMELGTDEENDTSIADRPEDIKPQFHKGKESEARQDEGDEEEGSGGMEDYMDMWTVRKSAAQALDHMAQQYPEQILPILLPLVDEQLSHSDWLVRESGVLALGAIAAGCEDTVQSHLPKLIPFLIGLTRDPNSMIRLVTCWTLTRYASWMIERHENAGLPSDSLMVKSVEALCSCVLDKNKLVQAAACSALSEFEESAGLILEPLAHPICKTLSQALQIYQVNNMTLLLDSVSSLFEGVKEGMARPEILQTVLPPLWQKWNSLPDTDRSLFGIMEAFGSIVQVVGLQFREFAMPVFTRCLRFIENTVVIIASSADAGVDPTSVDREFMITALDVLSSMAEGFESNFNDLINNSNLVPLLLEVLKDSDYEVAQVSFGLVGDIAKTAPMQIQHHIHAIVPQMCKKLYPIVRVSASINAIWALAEISLTLPKELEAYVPDVLNQLILIMQNDNLEKDLIENTVFTIGRLAINYKALVASRLEEFILRWLVEMGSSSPNEEKEAAVKGMCGAILDRPEVVAPQLGYLLVMIFRWDGVPGDAMHGFFKSFIQHLQTSLSRTNLWQEATASLPQPMQQNLSQLLQ